MGQTTDELIERLNDEADLCRNDHAGDVAALLDEAAKALRLYAALIPFDAATLQSERLKKVESNLENLQATVEREKLSEYSRGVAETELNFNSKVFDRIYTAFSTLRGEVRSKEAVLQLLNKIRPYAVGSE